MIHEAGAQRRWLVATVIGTAVVYAAFLGRCTFEVGGRRGFTLFDDAMISMRYARNLVEAGTLTWNPGEPNVEGYTNFLWTLWMALVHLLPIPELQISLVIALSGVALLALTGRAVVRLTTGLSAAPAAPVAALAATLLSYGLVYWSLRGMEVALLACVVTTGAAVLVRTADTSRTRDRLLLGAATAVALLTRPDAAVFVVVWIGYVALALRGRERVVMLVVVATVSVATLAAHATFRHFYYGDLLPNTYYLKLASVPLATRIARGVTALVYELQCGWLVPAGFAGLALARPDGRRTKLLLATIVLAATAYSISVGGDAWEEFAIPNRFLAPALPALMVLAVSGIEVAAGSVIHRRVLALVAVAFAALQWLPGIDLALYAQPTDARIVHLRTAWGLIFALALSRVTLGRGMLVTFLLLATSGEAWSRWVAHGAQQGEIDADRVRHGLALRAATTVDATIATTAAGNIPYFARRRCIDLLGKSDPRVARSAPRTPRFYPGHVKWDYAYSLGELQPDVVDGLFTPPQAWRVAAEKALLPTWGYVEIGENFYVRDGTRRVDVPRLVRDLSLPQPGSGGRTGWRRWSS